jgi:hypothetical protein
MQSFSWYLNRLRRMSFGEMAYRVKQTAAGQLQMRGLVTVAKTPPVDATTAPDPWLSEPAGINVDNYLKAADLVVRGQIRLFALKNASLGQTPNWNKEIKAGVEAPLAFGKKLDHRDQRLVGDIKYLWEPNRHLQLVTLAQAFRLTGAPHYSYALQNNLDSWFLQCPHLKGPNWASSLELGIRLINWAFAWQLVGGTRSTVFEGQEGRAFRDRWLTSIYRHAQFIAGHLSRFSSANNHFIGELTGLFVAGCTWPLWPDMATWRELGYRTLIREVQRQTFEDGVDREQAIYYQHYVMDFLLIAALAGQSIGIDFPEEYWARLERMIEFIASIMDVRGNVPMIGDGDSGSAVELSQEHRFCPYRSLLATGAVLFDRADFKRKAGWLDDKTRWLLGRRAEQYFNIDDRDARLPVRQAFPEGGYYILGADFETENEVRLIVDAGPLGYPSIAAHGHADALAFTLSVGGLEFLVDPGTYTYHTRPRWRDYFRGTLAHNTVTVDGADQSTSGGNFMWVRHAQAKCEAWRSDPNADLFCGSHDGYMRLPDPVTHRREIRLHKRARQIEIKDFLFCKQAHTVEHSWHFSEECTISQQDNRTALAKNKDRSITLRLLDERAQVFEYRGDADRPAGWISREYDVKIPTTTIVWTRQITGDTTTRAVIDY